ncbi:MAG: hypothetical protein IPM39_27365 [Chloroflexi bacterium]|nr:hypothetical protein [Chloroflexota bacterium]
MSMPITYEEISTAANDIAAQLQETHPPAILQIRRIVEQIGVEAAYEFLQKALEVEARGGMLTYDEKQRRTPGGTFFYIVRGQVTPEIRRILWPWNRKKRNVKSESKPEPPTDRPERKPTARPVRKAISQPPILPWDERETLVSPALTEKGTASTVKITLVGRPGKVIERPDAVILTMTAPKPPALPKGLPILPETAVTVYLVYVARKQWDKVAAAIQNPEDKLVIEGYPFLDAKLNVIGVLTQNVNTVMLQRAARIRE